MQPQGPREPLVRKMEMMLSGFWHLGRLLKRLERAIVVTAFYEYPGGEVLKYRQAERESTIP